VGIQPDVIAVTPDGKTVYVADNPGPGSLIQGTVVPITTATGKAGQPIDVGSVPTQLTVTPDGKTLLVLVSPYPHSGPTKLKSIATKTNKLGKSVTLPGNVNSVTVAPGGKVAYAAGAGPAVPVRKHLQRTGVITPVTISSMTEGKRITLGNDEFGGSLAPTAVMFSSNGKWAYVVYPGVNGLDRVNLTTGRDVGNKIRLSVYPNSGVLSADGGSVYVHAETTFNAIDLATGAVTDVPLSSWGGPAVPYPFAKDIALSPDGETVYSLVFGKTNGAVVPVSEPGNVREHPITVGVKPVELIIVP
jgi:DNA-binding beta-propeller fold protein YncE